MNHRHKNNNAFLKRNKGDQCKLIRWLQLDEKLVFGKRKLMKLLANESRQFIEVTTQLYEKSEIRSKKGEKVKAMPFTPFWNQSEAKVWCSVLIIIWLKIDSCVDNAFSFTTSAIEMHQSFATTRKCSTTKQSLIDLILALPPQLLFQYVDLPSSVRSLLFEQTAQKKGVSLPIRGRKDINLHSVFHPFFIFFISRERVAYATRLDLSSRVYHHRQRFNDVSRYTKLGLLCLVLGRVHHHFDCLREVIQSTRIFPSYWKLRDNNFYEEYRYLILRYDIACRAMKHVESICLKGYSHQMDPNPCFRYYIENYVLSGYEMEEYYIPTLNEIREFSLSKANEIYKRNILTWEGNTFLILHAWSRNIYHSL